MNIFIWTIICIITGAAGICSLGLYPYIQQMDGTEACERCSKRRDCLAKKKIFNDSDYLNEFMLFTYINLKLKKFCDYIKTVPIRFYIVYIFFNTILVSFLYWSREYGLTCIAFSVSGAMLLALSVVDWNTQYIPVEYTGVILICGLIRLFADISNWWEYVIGLIAVSGFLYIVEKIGTPVMRRLHPDEEINGVMGDGDIKLMAATGLLIGWKLNFLALGIGCIIGSVIHIILMKIKGSGQRLALGPYLSLGVYLTMICGEQLVSWYLNMIGFNSFNTYY